MKFAPKILKVGRILVKVKILPPKYKIPNPTLCVLKVGIHVIQVYLKPILLPPKNILVQCPKLTG